MKKIAIFTIAFLVILILTKIANKVPPEPLTGVAFSLKAQQVVQCSATEITLVDMHQKATHLIHDESWPDCSIYQKEDVIDFYLSRSEKTHFLHMEKTPLWRRVM